MVSFLLDTVFLFFLINRRDFINCGVENVQLTFTMRMTQKTMNQKLIKTKDPSSKLEIAELDNNVER
jgi:hypothetical protein